jgi:hypothetical protein
MNAIQRKKKKLANPNDAFGNQKETRFFLGFFFLKKKKKKRNLITRIQPNFLPENQVFFFKKKKSYFTLVPPK